MPFRIKTFENPYVPIDVGYFDRKAMEKQQRHDLAREAWSEMVIENANQSYVDENARKNYLETQQQLFKDVVGKHSGNLSAGLHDIMGAMETAKSDPYLNLNAAQMKAIEEQKLLKEKYGANYIDQSQGLYDPLLNSTTGQYRDVSTIKAGALEANDYQTILENQMKELSPIIEKYTGPLQNAGQGYLQAVTTALKQLSPEMLNALASDPTVYQAFLANAPTALQDTRMYGNTGQTYRDMFSTQKGFADYFMGNLIDKTQYEKETTRSYHQDWRAKQANQHAYDKKLIDYDRLPTGSFIFNLNESEETVNGNTIANLDAKEEVTRGRLNNITDNINNISLKRSRLLPGDPSMDIDARRALMTPDQRREYDHLTTQLNTLQADKYNTNLEVLRTGNQKKQIDDAIWNAFKEEYGDDYKEFTTVLGGFGDSPLSYGIGEYADDDPEKFLREKFESNDVSWLEGMKSRIKLLGKLTTPRDFMTKMNRNYNVLKDEFISGDKELDIKNINRRIAPGDTDHVVNRYVSSLSGNVTNQNLVPFLSNFSTTGVFQEGSDVLTTNFDEDGNSYNEILKKAKEEGYEYNNEASDYYMQAPNALSGGIELGMDIVLTKEGAEDIVIPIRNAVLGGNTVNTNANVEFAKQGLRDAKLWYASGSYDQAIIDQSKQQLTDAIAPRWARDRVQSMETDQFVGRNVYGVNLGDKTMRYGIQRYSDGTYQITDPSGNEVSAKNYEDAINQIKIDMADYMITYIDPEKMTTEDLIVSEGATDLYLINSTRYTK